MIKQWFKFYGGEFLSDPKIERLNPLERSCWITLLCLASTSSDEGVIEFLTVETLLNKSGIQFDPYHPEEWEKALSVLQKLKSMRMIELNENGVINIINWEKRQEHILTNSERQAKYRLNKKSNEKVTRVTTKVTLEKNRIEKNREEENINTSEQSSQELPLLIDLFKTINPSYKKWFGNKTQRSACSRMIETHGFDKLKKVIEFLPVSNTRKFAPIVTTPLQLEDKFGQLVAFWSKEKENTNQPNI